MIKGNTSTFDISCSIFCGSKTAFKAKFRAAGEKIGLKGS